MGEKTINRNDLCPCGSGKKYKQCCQALDQKKKPSSSIL
ncbi:MAG: SEC-C domain-containing protein [Moraxellaceae bacterium]|nr:SEC-C domain-containing protein [Moraxellaceae bacterium]